MFTQWWRKNVAWPFALWGRQVLRKDPDVSYDEYVQFVRETEQLRPKGE